MIFKRFKADVAVKPRHRLSGCYAHGSLSRKSFVFKNLKACRLVENPKRQRLVDPSARIKTLLTNRQDGFLDERFLKLKLNFFLEKKRVQSDFIRRKRWDTKFQNRSSLFYRCLCF